LPPEGSLSADDQNRNFTTLADGTVINQFDSAFLLEGAVVDVSTDPPFTIGSLFGNGLPDPNAFGGPTTVTSQLQNTVAQVPEPTTLALMGLGLAIIGLRRRKLALKHNKRTRRSRQVLSS